VLRNAFAFHDSKANVFDRSTNVESKTEANCISMKINRTSL
jgi:hypothetical protein